MTFNKETSRPPKLRVSLDGSAVHITQISIHRFCVCLLGLDLKSHVSKKQTAAFDKRRRLVGMSYRCVTALFDVTEVRWSDVHCQLPPGHSTMILQPLHISRQLQIKQSQGETARSRVPELWSNLFYIMRPGGAVRLELATLMSGLVIWTHLLVLLDTRSVMTPRFIGCLRALKVRHPRTDNPAENDQFPACKRH